MDDQVPDRDQVREAAAAQVLRLFAALSPEEISTLDQFIVRVAAGDLVARTLFVVIREVMTLPVVPRSTGGRSAPGTFTP
jgi:hypothetical protein